MSKAATSPESGPESKPVDPLAPLRASGYIITDDTADGLRDMFNAMDITAIFIAEADKPDDPSEVNGSDVSALLRSFARLGRFLMHDTVYAYNAGARPAPLYEREMAWYRH